jgi:hypothetical protein
MSETQSKSSYFWLALSTILLAFLVVKRLPDLIENFRPPEGVFLDFIQEWLSARNYWDGHPIYEEQSVSFDRNFAGNPHEMFRYNAHPPVSVLFALPFAQKNYRDSTCAWNAVGVALFLSAIGLIAREFRSSFRSWHLVPIAAILVWSFHVRDTINMGQLNFFLAFFLTLAWVCDRRGYTVGAGVLTGLAAAMKLYPGFVIVYFLASGRWRAAAAFTITVIGMNGIALGVLGVNTYTDYFTKVLPSLQQFESNWCNVSLYGIIAREVNPLTIADGSDFVRRPLLAKGLYALAFIAVAGCVAYAGRRAKRDADVDVGWAAAITSLLLVSPVTWGHYYVILLVPLAVLAVRLSPGQRPLAWLTFLIMNLQPHDIYPRLLWKYKGFTEDPLQTHNFNVAMATWENLLVAAIPTYALLVFFALTLRIPAKRGDLASPSDSGKALSAVPHE